MEAEQTPLVWPWKVLTIPPVWISQSLMVSSSLVDARNVPSSEKVRDVIPSICPERIEMVIPVIASRVMIQHIELAAIIFPQHSRGP